MTKKELMEMLKDIDENETLNFVTKELDRDGYPYDRVELGVYKVLGEKIKTVRENYGIERIYNDRD